MSTAVPIQQLSICHAFNGLSGKAKLYAHHMAKAVWSGTRIILRQVSPESNGVFDLLMEMHRDCHNSYEGDWTRLADACGVSRTEIDAFLSYAAAFLSNVGNYYVRLTVLSVCELQLITRFRVRGIKSSAQSCKWSR